jgi:hypothetical protein
MVRTGARFQVLTDRQGLSADGGKLDSFQPVPAGELPASASTRCRGIGDPAAPCPQRGRWIEIVLATSAQVIIGMRGLHVQEPARKPALRLFTSDQERPTTYEIRGCDPYRPDVRRGL